MEMMSVARLTPSLRSHLFPVAIFSKPDESRLAFPKELRVQSVPLFLICDNVRDPGSLGTILRCAAAAGCDRVLLTQGTSTVCVYSLK